MPLRMDHSSSSTTNSVTSEPLATRDPYTLPPEAIDLATRLFNAARAGDLPIFEQAIPAGLPANLTNDKGDTLVPLPPSNPPFSPPGSLPSPFPPAESHWGEPTPQVASAADLGDTWIS